MREVLNTTRALEFRRVVTNNLGYRYSRRLCASMTILHLFLFEIESKHR